MSTTPWIEKYRPSDIKDVILDDQIRTIIEILINNRKNTHMIFTGSPGVGKTSTVRCIAKKILGTNLADGFLELNDTDSRVKHITSIIPPFCRRSVNFVGTKIILLDESDNITTKCQFDICNLINEYGHNTNFIFTCNDSTKIIESIQSVCRIIRFSDLSEEQIKTRLTYICEKEQLNQTTSGLDMICYISTGDMRKAINNLQVTANLFNKITKKSVLTICKMPDPVEINVIIGLCLEKNLTDAYVRINNIIMDGYYYLDIITGFNYVLNLYDIPDDLKLKLIDVVNQTKIIFSTSVRSKLQLLAMISRLIDVVP